MNEKRQQIITTAKELFFKHGPKRVTVEEICRNAGVSKMTYYKHFPNKAELVRFIGQELVDIGFRQFDEISELDIPYPQKIQKMTEWKMSFFSSISTEFISEIVSLDEIGMEAKTRYLRNISAAQEKGEIRRDLSPELVWLVTEKLNELIRDGDWKKAFEDYSVFQKQMRTLFFYGLLSRNDRPQNDKPKTEEL